MGEEFHEMESVEGKAEDRTVPRHEGLLPGWSPDYHAP